MSTSSTTQAFGLEFYHLAYFFVDSCATHFDVPLSTSRSVLRFSSNYAQMIEFYCVICIFFWERTFCLVFCCLLYISYATQIFLELHLKIKLFFSRWRISRQSKQIFILYGIFKCKKKIAMRSEADLNRCTRFCRPLPNRSAIGPVTLGMITTKRFLVNNSSVIH